MSSSSPVNSTRRLIVQAGASALCGGLTCFDAMAASPASSSTSKVLRLAVVPQLTPVEMTRYWSPVVQALGQAGINCELVVYPTIAKFEPEFLKGLADIVFMNPYHMVMARRAQRYEPVLRDTRPLEGVLVVRNDGPVKSMEQLKDHRLSFPAPNAFAASLYIRSVLERQYHLQFDTHYAGNHRNAIRQVLSGDSAAAGVVKTTLEQEPIEVRQGLRVIYTTPQLSPHPIAVHPRVSVAVRRKLTDTLVALAQNPETKALMTGIQMPNPVDAKYATDYAPLEQLKIAQFVVTE
jgi:phosphonate transport system substrate-binding protein